MRRIPILVLLALVPSLGGTSTAQKPRLLKDINISQPSIQGSKPGSFERFAPGRLLFAADSGTEGRELWITDMTTAGTRLVKDILPGAAGSKPEDLTRAGNQIFFTADDGKTGREL